MAAIEVVGLGWAAESEQTAESKADVAALVREYSGVMYRVAFSILRNAAEAEDAVQDAFLRVVQHRERLNGVKDARTWLIRIVWNLALDRKRRVSPEQMDEAVVAAMVAKELPADERMAEARRLVEVYGAIDRLPKREREALLLSVIEELSTAEIAAVVGRSESSVRALLFRARERLRERLDSARTRGGER
jgi:RNA polymerase sigma-70 factor (ECF subfamily)